MGQIKAGAIEKGMFLLNREDPCLVVEREFVNPGKGSAFVRLRLKNLINGNAPKVTHKSQDMVEEIDVSDFDAQYLYADEQDYHFMDNETFDQFTIERKSLPDKIYFLLEGESYRLVRWDERYLDIKLPPKVDIKVTEAAEGLKGDTVGGATKKIKLETGLEIKAPLFVKEGDVVRVNTETKEYQERINS